MNWLDPLPNHKTLSILPTYKCTAACKHCGTLSSPKEKVFLPEELIIKAIDQAAESGKYKIVGFSGGEPTLIGDVLLKAIKHAKSKGLFTRIVSNAFWAFNEERATRKLSELINAGLDEINFSTGDEHAKYVPLERVLIATKVALGFELNVGLMIELTAERKISQANIEKHPLFKKYLPDYPYNNLLILESPWMPLDPFQVNDYPSGLLTNKSNIDSRKGCDSILQTTTIQADGQIGACCGLGLRLIKELQVGNIESVTISEADTEASNDILKKWIQVEGPEKILAWSAKYDETIEWENMYAHKCQACLRLYKDPQVRKVIKENYQKKLVDIVIGDWLLHEYEI